MRPVSELEFSNMLSSATKQCTVGYGNPSFSGLNLADRDFTSRWFNRVTFAGSNLQGASFAHARLFNCSFNYADLTRTNFSRAICFGCTFADAKFDETNFSSADLIRPFFSGDISGAQLGDITPNSYSLENASFKDGTEAKLFAARMTIVPEGDIVGWKKCCDDVIVKLLIPKRAKRSSAGGRKCRASYARVLQVFGAKTGVSLYDERVTYTKGKLIKPKNGFDTNRFDECAPGIHFFLTREEAEAYS